MSFSSRPGRGAERPPALAVAIFRTLLPLAERDEVVADLEAEYGERVSARGRRMARRWVWRCRPPPCFNSDRRA